LVPISKTPPSASAAFQGRTSQVLPLAREVLCESANAAGDIGAAGFSCFNVAWLQNRTHMAGSLPLDQYVSPVPAPA